MPAVVQPSCARVGVAREMLHILQRHALLQQVGDGGRAERMAAQLGGVQACLPEPTPDHPQDIARTQRSRWPSSTAVTKRPKQRRLGWQIAECRDVVADVPLQIMPGRDDAFLAAFLVEPKQPLPAIREEVAPTQPGDSAGAHRRVNQHSDDRPVPQADE